jgi:Domain of unknown function (DUF1963)
VPASPGLPQRGPAAYLALVTTDPRAAVRAIFASTGLARQRDAIAALGRNSVFLHGETEASAPLPPGVSRAFGDPDLPVGAPWPAFERPYDELASQLRPGALDAYLDAGELVRAKGEGGREVLRARLEFIAQVRLDDVAEHDVDGLLPRRGLLSFFLAPELLLERVDRPGRGRYLVPSSVLYIDGDPAALRPLAPPAESPPPRRAPCPLSFSHGLTLPSPDHAAITALGLEASAYGRVAWQHDQDWPIDRMLGYHAGTYEFGLPAPGDVLLFEATHLDWVNAHVMFVCIPEGALAARDFAAAYCVPSLE